MTEEEKIKQELEEKFAYLKDAVIIKRKGRVFAELPLDKFDEVFDYAIKQMRFSALSAITGMDKGEAFAVIYHLNREGKIILNLSVGLNKENPAVKTVIPYFPGADIYEREMVDLLGIEVEGLAPGNRYPLPDNWPKDEHPLRKDWKGSTYNKEAQNA
ncbi:MAG: NADH-quinone oxidoreductase subunit C [Deltaproteobacteria bacterium]